jgi:hypothetical protein
MLTKDDLEKIEEIESDFADGLQLEPEQLEFLCSKLHYLNDELKAAYDRVY